MRDAQFRTACAGVSLDLLGSGNNRLASHDVEYRLFTAHANGQVRRTRAPICEMGERLFDDAVLERVVRDHQNPSARIQPAHRCVKTTAQHGELRVDFYPERLESALRRMTAATPCRCRNRRLDDVDQLEAGLDFPVLTLANDEFCDARRPLFIRVSANDPSEICCVIGVDDLFCG